MKKSRFSLDDLTQQLREQGVFDVNEIEYALLEVSGKVSILKKEQYKNVTKNSILINNPKKQSLPIELIMDGKVIEENLTSIYSHAWIEREFQNRTIEIKEVYYAVIGTNGYIYFDLYKDEPNFLN